MKFYCRRRKKKGRSGLYYWLILLVIFSWTVIKAFYFIRLLMLFIWQYWLDIGRSCSKLLNDKFSIAAPLLLLSGIHPWAWACQFSIYLYRPVCDFISIFSSSPLLNSMSEHQWCYYCWGILFIVKNVVCAAGLHLLDTLDLD